MNLQSELGERRRGNACGRGCDERVHGAGEERRSV